MTNDQVFLEEDFDKNYTPTEEEINEYARVIGLDQENEPNHLWVAREGINAPLLTNWKPCQNTTGDNYYFNFETGDSIWDHPCDEFYRRMVAEERQKSKLDKKKDTKKKVAPKNNLKQLPAGLGVMKLTPASLKAGQLGSLSPVRLSGKQQGGFGDPLVGT